MDPMGSEFGCATKSRYLTAILAARAWPAPRGVVVFCRRSLETLGWIIKFVTLINYNMYIHIYVWWTLINSIYIYIHFYVYIYRFHFPDIMTECGSFVESRCVSEDTFDFEGIFFRPRSCLQGGCGACVVGMLRCWDDPTMVFGYGSIHIDTFLVGWTSIYQLFWGSLGTRVLTHSLWWFAL